ncbi:FAD-dependent monooxygenase [Roseomonas sp. OT10]|uniref:FAD-dependent oxidoreductase n=1 Tax=Roseomonas cutis TaxID=2897332 RepID=UPI001E29BDBA|nr:FAD-dependent monooxygenase [Roseomonas sp. OT10]UFN50280.1 FAD-dependent monooxygenase [Roseomonas sp. OT10]
MPDPIVIVGAGPTGLTAALSLGLAGIPVLLLEAEPALTHDLRAGSYHPPTIEMLDALGVAGRMHETGIKVPTWQIRDRLAGVVAEFDLSLLQDETPYPYRLHLEQHRLTPLLLDRIREAAPSVAVRFAAPVETVAQDGSGATVTLREGEAIRASCVIGADGSRSVVRKAMGVEFEGFTWPDRFLVASTTFDLGALGFSGAGYIADPEAWAAVFHVPDTGPPGLWRIAYPIPPEAEEEVELRPENIQRHLFHLLESARPEPPGGRFTLKYASVYRVHQRVAQRFADRRLILAGDAAHVNNPLGGLGLNGSVHDAVNLAAKLARIWHDGADRDTLLDLYDRQRRPINIRAVQAMSIRNKALLEEKDPAVRRQRLEEQRALAADPVRAKAHLMNTSMINSVREAAAIT